MPAAALSSAGPIGRRRLLGYGVALAAAGGAGAAWAWWPHADHGPADAPAQLRVATGPPGAVYRAVGGALVQVLAERLPQTRVQEIQTGASVDNLALLASGGTELAFASLDSIVDGLAKGTPRDVTAVARLYDSWLQVFVLADSPVLTFPQLQGRPLAAGAAGSGTRFTLDRLDLVAGIQPQLVNATQTDGAALLAAGRVDGYATLTGVPTPAVRELAPSTRLRMLPLDGYVDQMQDRFGELYTPATLPTSAYPGVAATPTFTVPNLLLAQPDLAPDVVALVAGVLFAERARIAEGHPEANRINVRTGISTGPVRLHPGAERYFRSVKS